MPTTPPDPPQTGMIAAIAVIIGGLFTAAGNWAVGKLTRKTTLEVRAADGHEAYTDDLRDDVKALRQEVHAAQLVMDGLRKEIDTERRLSIGRERQIARLEVEIEKLQAQIVMLQDEKRKTQQDYELQITTLQSELVEKQAEIDRLRQQIKDFESIGVGEKPPAPRMKGTDGP